MVLSAILVGFLIGVVVSVAIDLYEERREGE